MTIKLVVGARRLPGLSHRQYVRYIHLHHGGLVRHGPASFQDIHLRYRQNHVLDGFYGAELSHPYDSFSELWFESPDSLKAATEHPYYTDTVAPDEPKFGDTTNLLVMLTSEHVRDVRDRRQGRAKLMHFAKRSPDLTREQFGNRWDAAIGKVLTDDRLADRVCACVLSVPLSQSADTRDDFLGGAHMNTIDGLTSLWFDRAGDPEVELAAAVLREAFNGVVDGDRSFAVIVDEVLLKPLVV